MTIRSKAWPMFLVLTGTLTSGLTFADVAYAQEETQRPPPIEQRPTPQPVPNTSGRFVYNSVMGVVGEKALLARPVDLLVQQKVDGELAAGRRLTQAERDDLRLGYLREIAKKEILAENAKTTTGSGREMMDRFVQERVQEFRLEQFETYGSVNETVRQLEALGMSWDAMAADQETELLYQYQLSVEVNRRFHDKLAMLITPKQMREWYEAHKDQFVRPPSTDVEVISIRRGSDSAELHQSRANVAARAWSEPDVASEEVAIQYGGIVLDLYRGVQNRPEDPRAAPIKEFAGKATLHEVAQLTRGPTIWLLKAVSVEEGVDAQFQSREVQRRIATELIEDLYHKLQVQLWVRSARNLFMMPEQLRYLR